MKLSKDKICNAILCAQKVLDRPEIFAGDPNKIAISIDAVSDFIAEDCNVDIEIREVVFEAIHLKGRKESYSDGKVLIDIRSDLSDFWKRFVALKEIMHIIVDKDEDDLTPYGDVLLEKLVLEGHIGVISGDGDAPPAQSELVAEIAAIQVIYPMSLRLADLERTQNGETTLAKLALHYEAPTPILSTAVNQSFLRVIVSALEGNS